MEKCAFVCIRNKFQNCCKAADFLLAVVEFVDRREPELDDLPETVGAGLAFFIGIGGFCKVDFLPSGSTL